MAKLTIKERYAKVDISKLPESYQREYRAIKEDSENFDPDLIDLFDDNFDKLYGMTEKNHASAIKKGGTLKKVVPSETVKVKAKKKVEPKAGIEKWVGKTVNYKTDIGNGYESKVLEVLSNNYLHLQKIDDNSKFRLKMDGIKMWEVKAKEFVPKSRGKKKELKAPASNHVDECREVLKEAGYSMKKKTSADGKRVMKHKAPRPERTIINEKVDDTFKTINKDISGSEDKDKKYSVMQTKLKELQSLFNKLFNKLNNLAEDNSTAQIDKIITTLKDIIG